jgi:hypothetical protein
MYSFRTIFIFLLLIKPVFAGFGWDDLVIPFAFNFLPTFGNITYHSSHRDIVNEETLRESLIIDNACGCCLALTYNCYKIYPGNFNEFYLSALKCHPEYLSACGGATGVCFTCLLAGTFLANVYLDGDRDQPILLQPIGNQPIIRQPIDNQPIDNQPIIRQPIDNQPIDNQPILRQRRANQGPKTLEDFLTQAPSEHKPRPCQICLERFPNIELECKHTMCKECSVNMLGFMNTLKCPCGVESKKPDNMRILYNP